MAIGTEESKGLGTSIVTALLQYLTSLGLQLFQLLEEESAKSCHMGLDSLEPAFSLEVLI